MTMRVGRRHRRAVIGHPVIRKRSSDQDSAILTGGIERRRAPGASGTRRAPSASGTRSAVERPDSGAT